MKEGDKIIEQNLTEEEKDLGVFITKDLKIHEQRHFTSKQARTIIVSKVTRVTAQALYNHRGKKC